MVSSTDDSAPDMLWAALNFGSEISDASTASDVYLAEYFNRLPPRPGLRQVHIKLHNN